MTSICTWFYVAAQMMQRVNGFVVTLLIHVITVVITVELRPAGVLHYVSE